MQISEEEYKYRIFVSALEKQTLARGNEPN